MSCAIYAPGPSLNRHLIGAPHRHDCAIAINAAAPFVYARGISIDWFATTDRGGIAYALDHGYFHVDVGMIGSASAVRDYHAGDRRIGSGLATLISHELDAFRAGIGAPYTIIAALNLAESLGHSLVRVYGADMDGHGHCIGSDDADPLGTRWHRERSLVQDTVQCMAVAGVAVHFIGGQL